MGEPQRIEDLSAGELKAVLATEAEYLTEEQIHAIQCFLTRIGGIENAILALEALDRLEEAA